MENKIYLNRIRILASLFVVAIHVSAIFFYDYSPQSNIWLSSTFLNCLSRTAVPLFFFVSGAIYLNEDKDVSIKKLLKTILRFIVIFLIWDLLYSILSTTSSGGGGISYKKIIIFLKNYKFHLWYLLSYIFLLAITPIVRLICKKENQKQIKYLLILFVCTTSILKFLSFLFSNINSSFMFVKMISYGLSFLNTLFNKENLASCIILYISGWYFSTFDFESKKGIIKTVKWITGILTPIITLLLCYSANSSTLFGFVSNYYYLPCYCLTVSIFLTFRYSKIANTPNKFWDFIGKKTLGIYLVHAIFLKVDDFIFSFLNSPLMLIVILLFYIFAIYVISLIFSILLNLLPKKIRHWIC